MYIELVSKKKPRYYIIESRPNLFGGYSVWLRWGGIGKRPSRVVKEDCSNSSQARRLAWDNVRRKRKDGYS